MAPIIGHNEVKAYAEDRVNLSAAKAAQHRAQVNGLRERLEKKINANPDYGLVKMLHAGSVAKGTALSDVHYLDTAVYVKAAAAPDGSDGQLVHWLADRLYEANTNMSREQFVEQQHCVTVSFKGSGLDVDVVPVLYEGDEDDRGYLVRKHTGDRVLTSITLPLRASQLRCHPHARQSHALIRGIDGLRNDRLPVLTLMCTNRAEALDPAVRRRAARVIRFVRPNDEGRRALLERSFDGVKISDREMKEMVQLTGPATGRPFGCTYSDLRQQLIPQAVLRAVDREEPLTATQLIALAKDFEPTRPFDAELSGP